MKIAAYILIALVALLHFCFMILEMFLWDKPAGLRAFSNTSQRAKDTKLLAANQGLYNGFIAAGLTWGLLNANQASTFIVFFLICVIVAGIFGGITVSRRILTIQALPAMISLALFLCA